jgi:glycerol uptake facilitator-like aquaporin
VREKALNLSRRLAAEALGSALLLATIVGSGIMGEKLAAGNVAIALLANTLATGAMLARTPLIPEVNDSEENIRATLEWRNY